MPANRSDRVGVPAQCGGQLVMEAPSSAPPSSEPRLNACSRSRARVVSRQASDDAKGREVAGRMERLMGEERRDNWMAS